MASDEKAFERISQETLPVCATVTGHPRESGQPFTPTAQSPFH
jgi:hypothetical protein